MYAGHFPFCLFILMGLDAALCLKIGSGELCQPPVPATVQMDQKAKKRTTFCPHLTVPN